MISLNEPQIAGSIKANAKTKSILKNYFAGKV